MQRISPNRLRAFVVAISVALAVPLLGGGSAVAGGAPEPRVVLANHLNGPWSTTHSFVGADFDVIGTPVYRPGVLGRSIGVVDDESLLLMSSDDFFGADRSQGTVSVWLKKNMVSSVPYVTPLAGVFGEQPYDFQDAWCSSAAVHNPAPRADSCTNYGLTAAWGDGVSGPAGLFMVINDSSGTPHRAVDPAFNTSAVPVGRWVKVTFVWDLDGIRGSADTMRIYRGCRLVASYAAPIPDIVDLPTPVSFAGSHATDRLDRPALLLDELVVLDRAVTP